MDKLKNWIVIALTEGLPFLIYLIRRVPKDDLKRGSLEHHYERANYSLQRYREYKSFYNTIAN